MYYLYIMLCIMNYDCTYGRFLEVCVDVGEKVDKEVHVVLLALPHVVHQEYVQTNNNICLELLLCVGSRFY